MLTMTSLTLENGEIDMPYGVTSPPATRDARGQGTTRRYFDFAAV